MTPVNPAIITEINQLLEINLPGMATYEQLQEKLSTHINHLINHDFEKLVFYLYRIDVSESKMKALLEQKQGENAPGLIAGLIIDRQLEKIKSRREFRGRDNNIDDEEKW